MKKQLQSLAVALMALAGFSNQASALNSYAYGMGATLSEDAATLNVTYSLNAEATAVSVVFYNGAEVVKTVDLDAVNFTAGAHAVAVPTEGLPQGTQITWAVKATSAVVETATEHSVGYQFYHPRSVEVDNNTESPYFGRVYLTEAMVAKSDAYLSHQTGMGLYAFDPQLTPILNKDSKPGFKGGQTFPEKFENTKRAYSPTRVRVSADGRVFVSAQNDLGVAMWEINPADLNADWTKVIYGTPNAEDYKMYTADGAFIAGPNIGLDVRGEGENLTVLMHSSSKANTEFTYAVSTDEYKLGTAKEWTVAPTTNIDPLTDCYSISSSCISAAYDKDGGIWYCQYRSTPNDEQPGLVHVAKNADGTYVEDYKDLEVRGGGGIRFNKDFSQVAIAKGKGGVSVYTIAKDEAGKPVLTELYNFDTTIGTNVNDIAWDAANNLYVVGNSREWLKVFALPRANGDVTVAAPTAAAFTLPAAPEPKPELVYNLTEVSKFTEGLPVKSEARQAALGKDGKVYIHDKANKVIEVWTMDGKTTEVLADAGVNTSVTTDDAGNVIVPGAGYEFPGAAFNNLTSLKVYPADGSEAKEVAVAGMPAGRVDFLGHVQGNILAGEAVMYVPVQNSQDVVALRFLDGAQDGDAAVVTLTNATAADNMTVAHGNATGFMHHRRGAKASVRLVKAEYDDAMGEYTVDDSFLVTTPGMQASVGATKFTMGGVDYVVYPTGSGYYDGWAIVKASNAEENPVLVEHAETTTTVTSGFQTNWLMVDVMSDTKAMVYQYFPGGYFATYEFTATENGNTPEPPTPAYPENVYLAGHLENAAWDPAYDGYKMTATANEGEYSIENVVVVEADAEANKGFGYFAFTTAVGTWDDVNASDRFGAESADFLIESEKSAKVVKGQYSWKAAAGTYNMLLNLKDMTLVITKLSGVDAVEAAVKVIAGAGVINVVGEAKTIEVYSASGALVSAGAATVECAPGIYLVRVDGNITKVVVR